MACRSSCARTLAVVASALVFVAAVPAHATPAAEAALAYVKQHKQEFGLTGSDVKEMSVSSEVASAHNGITNVYLQQGYRGIGVYNAILTVNVRQDGSVLSAGSRFVSNLASLAGGQNARKTAAEAGAAAARHLGLKPWMEIRPLSHKGGANEATKLSDGGIAARPIEAQLVWMPRGDAVRLAWSVEIEELSGDHWWVAFVDAETGASLGHDDLVVHDDVAAVAGGISRPAGSPAALTSFADLDGASYNVFAAPFESPSDGERTLVSGAADPAASPFGWHDTDGLPGAEFTRTRGNNVHAYTDLNADNVADPGTDPDGGATLQFDFALDLALDPSTYRPAAVTNLFYWNNIVHDVTLGYGFDEAAGNFQVTNYTGAVGGGDDVRAEAQDGSGINNANFFTPAQNAGVPRPRMQMFIWTHPRPNSVSVASGGAAGDYEASGAAFGPTVATAGPITAEVALVDDGVIGTPVPPSTTPGTLADGCEPFGGVAGKIALVERGFCTFVIKVKNAQNAGAVAVIVANNVAGAAVTLGGADPTITIPAVMVSLADSEVLRANLPLTATIKLDPTRSLNRDSDLDAGVIAHEYGHGISNRLTGGPNIVTCLNNAEQMGEGWSDWFGITLTTHPSDTATTPRGVGTYLIYEPTDGNGIRPTPYSTDMTVNPSTYASVANLAISQPHGIGYVWNTMLWEMYWNLVDRYGYNANIYDPWNTAGNNLALQLVMDGMKLQVCRPGFVDGRDAILAADQALTAGANQCEIWRAFAKRGLGFSANQGSSANRSDGVEAFDLPATCTAATFVGFQTPIQNAPALNDVNAGSKVPVKFTLTGGAPLLDSQPVDCDTLVPTGEAPSPLSSSGNSGLQQSGDFYQINWATDASWEGTCRRLTVRITAPTNPVAYFRFH
jgi:extracellular elastinolytic metalloproteinase